MKTLQTRKEVTSYTLTTLQGSGQFTFVIDKKKMIIGTHAGCDIQLEGGNVSLYHAFLCLEDDGRMMVKDLASEAGTYVNGKRVEVAHITSGDTLKVGDCVFFAQQNEDEAPVFNPDDFIEVVPMEEEVVAAAAVEKIQETVTLEVEEVHDVIATVAQEKIPEPAIAASAPQLPFAAAHAQAKAEVQVEARAVPRMAAISQTLVLIDGELCDIIYDETNSKLLSEVPEMSFESEA